MHKPSWPDTTDLCSLHSTSLAQAVSLIACPHVIVVSLTRCFASLISPRTSLPMVKASGVRCPSTYIELFDRLYGCRCWCFQDSLPEWPSQRLESQFLWMIYLCWRGLHSSSRQIGSRLQYVCSSLTCRGAPWGSLTLWGIWKLGRRSGLAYGKRRTQGSFAFGASLRSWITYQVCLQYPSPYSNGAKSSVLLTSTMHQLHQFLRRLGQF